MRTYDLNFKQEAVKLVNEIGHTKAAKELNIPSGTLAQSQDRSTHRQVDATTECALASKRK